MGNTSTSHECLDHLNISILKIYSFKQDVLDFLIQEHRKPLDTLSSERIQASSRRYIETSKRYRQLQKPTKSTVAPKSSSDLSEWLSKLVKIWIEQKKHEEASKDPPYPAGENRKRKRKDAGAFKRSTRVHEDDQDDFAPSSAAENSSPLQGPPSALQPVQAVRSSDQDMARQSRSLNEDADGDYMPSATDVGDAPENLDAGSCVQVDGCRDAISTLRSSNLEPPRRSRNMIDIEDITDDLETVRAYSEAPNFMHINESRGQVGSSPPPPPPPPPPPLPFFTPPQPPQPILRSHPRQSPTESNSEIPLPTQPHRGDSSRNSQSLLEEIIEYIGVCETHSLQRATESTISEAERHTNRIRAMTFAALKRDIESRTHRHTNRESRETAAREQEGEGTRTPQALVTSSYCLWS